MTTFTNDDLISIAQDTGRSVEEVRDIAQRSGWTLTEDKPQRQAINPKDPVQMMRQIRETTLANLYQNDPLVREYIDFDTAVVETNKHLSNKNASNNVYDEYGNFKGVKKSVISGPHATSKHQAEAMKAIRDSIHKKYNVESAQ